MGYSCGYRPGLYSLIFIKRYRRSAHKPHLSENHFESFRIAKTNSRRADARPSIQLLGRKKLKAGLRSPPEPKPPLVRGVIIISPTKRFSMERCAAATYAPFPCFRSCIACRLLAYRWVLNLVVIRPN